MNVALTSSPATQGCSQTIGHTFSVVPMLYLIFSKVSEAVFCFCFLNLVFNFKRGYLLTVDIYTT